MDEQHAERQSVKAGEAFDPPEISGERRAGLREVGVFPLPVAEREGLSPTEAIRKAALLRFRPIMMTTMAALLGGVPLMLGTGTGSELRQPLGYAMVGGLAVSQLLTLFTTPVVYIYLDRLSRWLRSLGGKPAPHPDPAPEPAE